MQKSRLKNIINKSKGVSKDPFDSFKQTLPKEVDSNYRLKAAWKAYGSPSNYKEAVWVGMIQPIDENTYKLPSIGYNEETDEYEYLNSGKENETVAKDIRVWDNDVIPFVQELKLGGYVRTFNEEKDCWTYTRNSQKEEVESFLKGGKPKYEDWYRTLPKEKASIEDYDLEKAYNELPFEDLEKFRTDPQAHLNGDYKKSNHPTYGGYGNWIKENNIWHYYISPILIKEYPSRDFEWYKQYWDKYEPDSVFHWIDGKTYNKGIEEFKQGGSIIPEGSLHARKNNMEGGGTIHTAKGIPVMTADGKEQVAEIEKNEIIFQKSITDKIEELYKKYNEEESSSKKDDIAIEMGKILTCEIINNTEDRTGLIKEVENKL